LNSISRIFLYSFCNIFTGIFKKSGLDNKSVILSIFTTKFSKISKRTEISIFFWSISKHWFQKLTKTTKTQKNSSYTVSNAKIRYSTVESYIVYVLPSDAIWHHSISKFSKVLGTRRKNWEHLRSIGIIWDHLRSSGNTWEHLGTSENTWEHRRTFGNHLKFSWFSRISLCKLQRHVSRLHRSTWTTGILGCRWTGFDISAKKNGYLDVKDSFK
jgi:hypothetical protein